MTVTALIGTRIAAGIWEGVLTNQTDAPQLELLHHERSYDGIRVAEMPQQPGVWAVFVQIPSEALHQGAQTFVIRDWVTQTTLTHFTVIAGLTTQDDIRAEVDLLRAELDLLKRAFRRHCVDTAT